MSKPAQASKARFSPTKGTRIGRAIKQGANQLHDEQRPLLDQVVRHLMGKPAHAKVAAHRP
jgi:hypothetical protein